MGQALWCNKAEFKPRHKIVLHSWARHFALTVTLFSLWLAKWCKIPKVYIYSHPTLLLSFTNIFLHIQQLNLYSRNILIHTLTTYFLFTKIFTHIYEMYKFPFNGLYSFTFTIEILVQHGAIFIQHFLRTAFAHH